VITRGGDLLQMIKTNIVFFDVPTRSGRMTSLLTSIG
jgi:hypothetical protein